MWRKPEHTLAEFFAAVIGSALSGDLASLARDLPDEIRRWQPDVYVRIMELSAEPTPASIGQYLAAVAEACARNSPHSNMLPLTKTVTVFNIENASDLLRALLAASDPSDLDVEISGEKCTQALLDEGEGIVTLL